MNTKTAVLFSTWVATSLFAQSTSPTMKAIVVHEFGGPEILKLEDVPRPEPKENEILVKVIAAGVNPVDAGLRSGHYAKFFGPKPPFTPGADIAGVVETARATSLKLATRFTPTWISTEAVGTPSTRLSKAMKLLPNRSRSRLETLRPFRSLR